MIIRPAVLTKIDTGQPFSVDATHKGQAHFALRGTSLRCGKCKNRTPQSRGMKKYCMKAAELLGVQTPAVPKNAIACKYYEPV